MVKAAALPKRRVAASTSAAAATANEHREPSPSPTSIYDSDEDDEEETSLPLLWDLTAGLGTDSFLLAQAGWRVEMFERSPVVAALVQVYTNRVLLHSFVGLKLHEGGGMYRTGVVFAILVTPTRSYIFVSGLLIWFKVGWYCFSRENRYVPDNFCAIPC